MCTFYRGTIKSILTSCITVWYGACNASCRKSLQRIVRAAEKIDGVSLPSLQDIYNTRLTRKALCIAGDPTHPTHNFFSLLPSGRRLRSLQARTSRLKDSFIHQAVRKLNSLPSLPPPPPLLPHATLNSYIIIIILFFSTCPYLYICNSCILCTYAYIYIYIYIYVCMYVCMYVYIYIYIYIYLICTYLYFCGLLLVFSVICMHQGVKRVTQFQFSVCMYGTCGRIDNKADFDFFDFDYKKQF